MWMIILYFILAYLIGSISSAILVCKIAGLPDPRTTGSHNPGATNVLRLGGKRLAAFTLVGDILKGFIPVLLTALINPTPWVIGGVMLFSVLGHLYPIFFHFKGGKGVATFIGALFGMHWAVGLAFVITWLIVAVFSRISSLAAIVAMILAPVYTWLLVNIILAGFVLCISLLIILRHKENIKRLWKGTEPKLQSRLTRP